MNYSLKDFKWSCVEIRGKKKEGTQDVYYFYLDSNTVELWRGLQQLNEKQNSFESIDVFAQIETIKNKYYIYEDEEISDLFKVREGNEDSQLILPHNIISALQIIDASKAQEEVRVGERSFAPPHMSVLIIDLNTSRIFDIPTGRVIPI